MGELFWRKGFNRAKCRDEKSETTFKISGSKLFHECRLRLPVALSLFFSFFEDRNPGVEEFREI